MCAIERITSATRKIRKSKNEHEKSLVAAEAVPVRQQDQEEFEEVKIWNPTVANLTLMVGIFPNTGCTIIAYDSFQASML